MANFKGSIRGGRGAVSRLGHKTTGLTTENNGWNGGVRVCARYSEEHGDLFAIYATGGSNGAKSPEYIGTVDQKGNFVAAREKFPVHGLYKG